MTACCRDTVDVAGGTVMGQLAPTVFVNGTTVSVIGCLVAGHGGGPHSSPVLVTGSNTVFAHGIQVSRVNDNASCGCPVCTGSGNVFIG